MLCDTLTPSLPRVPMSKDFMCDQCLDDRGKYFVWRTPRGLCATQESNAAELRWYFLFL